MVVLNIAEYDLWHDDYPRSTIPLDARFARYGLSTRHDILRIRATLRLRLAEWCVDTMGYVPDVEFRSVGCNNATAYAVFLTDTDAVVFRLYITGS